MLDDSFRKRFKNIPLATSLTGNWGADPHNHSEMEVLYFEKGTQQVKIGDKVYHTKAGDLIFVNPMEIHSFTVDSGVESLSKCVCFDCSLVFNSGVYENIVSETTAVTHHIPKESQHNEYLKDLVLKMYDEALIEQSDEGVDGEIFSMEIRAYVTLLFAYIFKNYLFDKHLNKPKNADFCSSVIKYVKEHYVEPITSREVANALSFNQSYFCRNFKKNFGVSFSEYLTTYRLSLSRKLLLENDSVGDVAMLIGFQSSTQFSKCFKQKFGVLPSKYRKKSI